jgi:hypothetical protein
MVTFRLDAPESARAAAIKAVKGVVIARDGTGPSSAYYVELPSGGSEYQLQRLADDFIRQPPVRTVSPVRCPPRPSPPARADTTKPK